MLLHGRRSVQALHIERDRCWGQQCSTDIETINVSLIMRRQTVFTTKKETEKQIMCFYFTSSKFGLGFFQALLEH